MVSFSLIIPVKEINDYVRETVAHIKALDSSNWELMILPNEADRDEWGDSRIKIIPSGKVGPAVKRDLGAKFARGKFLVFLDDDSYPNKDLLNVASSYFDKTQIVAIGGPAITPPNDGFWQKVSGAVFLSRFSGGAPERYRPVGVSREVDDWPSVNFMVRKDIFLKIGGFDSPYWPGEDTRLCMELLEKADGKIIYVPEMIVWHHRRSGLCHHLSQVGAYGLHRGYFAKTYPKTSLKLKYFMPSLFMIFSILSLGVNVYPAELKFLFYCGWGVYIIAIVKSLYDISKWEDKLVCLGALPYIVLTHYYYGFRFICGLLKRKLVSKLR